MRSTIALHVVINTGHFRIVHGKGSDMWSSWSAESAGPRRKQQASKGSRRQHYTCHTEHTCVERAPTRSRASPFAGAQSGATRRGGGGGSGGLLQGVAKAAARAAARAGAAWRLRGCSRGDLFSWCRSPVQRGPGPGRSVGQWRGGVRKCFQKRLNPAGVHSTRRLACHEGTQPGLKCGSYRPRLRPPPSPL